MKTVTVTKEKGVFTADDGSPGSPIVGRGASVLEAVGEYAIQNKLVHVWCLPASLLSEYRIDMNKIKG